MNIVSGAIAVAPGVLLDECPTSPFSTRLVSSSALAGEYDPADAFSDGLLLYARADPGHLGPRGGQACAGGGADDGVTTITRPIMSRSLVPVLSAARRAELDTAYRQTEYHVFREPDPFFFRIDEPCEALSGEESWAFLTACNPGSDPLSAEENEQRLEQLRRLVAGRWFHLPGEGRSPDATWREASLWIRGIRLAEAIELAERFGQLALVWGDPVPRLIWTRWADHCEGS
jgi:hypothetical protein